MKLLLLSFLFISTGWAAPTQWMTLGTDTLDHLPQSAIVQKFEADDISVVELKTNAVFAISAVMHEKFNRCGGFMAHESQEEAFTEMHNNQSRNMAMFLPFTDYVIDQQNLVEPLVTQVDDLRIKATIAKLSSYRNRYYKAQTGVDSQNWLKSHWSELTEGRADIKVEMYKHKRWPQPSVILTWEGSTTPDEVVVIGGHADSINGRSFNRVKALAPGADDNASGIAVITETLKVLIDNNFKPEKTIKLMAYAAEEVGLLGSKEIAKEFKNQRVNVIGVLQLDMTNFPGSDKSLYLVTDYTNAEQNNYVGQLIDTYVKKAWGTIRCGYACSDHASWTGAGFPASFPFEAEFNQLNPKIHTTQDTLKVSKDNAFHSVPFAQLALAYAVEMSH